MTRTNKILLGLGLLLAGLADYFLPHLLESFFMGVVAFVVFGPSVAVSICICQKIFKG